MGPSELVAETAEEVTVVVGARATSSLLEVVNQHAFPLDPYVYVATLILWALMPGHLVARIVTATGWIVPVTSTIKTARFAR